MDLEAGFHSFGFSFLLPLNIPSSYESENGKICYKIEASFIRPWALCELRTKADFKVVTHVDLNLIPVLKLPHYSDYSRKLRQWIIMKKPLDFKVALPFTGYVPGQQLKVILDVNNKSRVDVSKIVIRLWRVTKLTTQKPHEETKVLRDVIHKESCQGIKRKSANNFDQVIKLPSDLVRVKHSNIISVTFEIEVIAKISSFIYQNPSFVFPIEIGSVPLNFDRFDRYSTISTRPSFMSKLI